MPCAVTTHGGAKQHSRANFGVRACASSGGLCVYRALLCRCPRALGSGNTGDPVGASPVSESSSSSNNSNNSNSSALSVVPLTDGSSRIHMITQKQMSDIHAAAEEAAAAAAAKAAAASTADEENARALAVALPGHSDGCARILVSMLAAGGPHSERDERAANALQCSC